MRSYPHNSPQAAARIVALAMLADGHVCKSELDLLERMDGHVQLGLAPQQMLAVVHEVCEDMLSASAMCWGGSCQVDAQTLAELLAEVGDPVLRTKVLNLCVALVESDQHVAEGESVVLTAAIEQWGLQQQILSGGRHRTQAQPA